MNGMTVKTEHISTIMNANARRWLGTPKIARSCATGRRRAPAHDVRRQRRNEPHAPRAPTTTLNAASARNGARHEKCAAIHSDNGTPATADSENAAATTAVAVARRA